MNSKHLAGVLALALLLASWPATAQTSPRPAPAPTEQQQKPNKELERKALVMLDEIIKDTQSFRIPENRLRLKAIAANLLWKYDEARARILFKDAMASIVDLLNNQDDDSDAAMPHLTQGAIRLRRELVQMLASHDARLAREFLRATQPSAQTKAQYGGYENDLQLEYSLATQITETDPKQALEIAEENLSKGLSNEILSTIRNLQEKNPEAAAKLAGEVVARLRSENLSNNNEAASIAASLLSMVFDAPDESDGKEKKKAAPLLDEQGMRELMEMNVNLALNSPLYSGRLQTLEPLMPQVQKYAPARVAELRSKMAQMKATRDSEDDDGVEESTTEWDKYRTLIEEGTAEELLAAAEKSPLQLRDGVYQAAAKKLAERGELDKAREIVNSLVKNPYVRKQMLAALEQQASLTAAEQGKMDMGQVRKSLQALRTNEERATMLAQIATALVAKGERKLARQLLNEAQLMVNYRAKNIKQMGAQLMVAQAYVRLDPARSLAMLEAIVDHLNELLAAAVTLGGFIMDEEIMQEDEIRMEILAEVLPMATNYILPDLRTLASFDFDRTRALSERFQRDEVRMMARLLVVQSVLGEQAAPTPPRDNTPYTTVTATTSTSSDDNVEGDGTP